MSGQKLRIQSSKVIDAQMRALGALPQVTSFAELYGALQTGVVDGQENPSDVIYPSKLYEVQKYLTVSDHGYHGYVVITNAKFWSGLPSDIRTALEGAMKDTTAYFNETAMKENDDSLEAIRKAGKTQIVVLTPEKKRHGKKCCSRCTGKWATSWASRCCNRSTPKLEPIPRNSDGVRIDAA